MSLCVLTCIYDIIYGYVDRIVLNCSKETWPEISWYLLKCQWKQTNFCNFKKVRPEENYCTRRETVAFTHKNVANRRRHAMVKPKGHGQCNRSLYLESRFVPPWSVETSVPVRSNSSAFKNIKTWKNVNLRDFASMSARMERVWHLKHQFKSATARRPIS